MFIDCIPHDATFPRLLSSQPFSSRSGERCARGASHSTARTHFPALVSAGRPTIFDISSKSLPAKIAIHVDIFMQM